MNLLEMFKQLSKEDKKEFINLIKKEIQTEIKISIPKVKINLADCQKTNLTKSQLFGL